RPSAGSRGGRATHIPPPPPPRPHRYGLPNVRPPDTEWTMRGRVGRSSRHGRSAVVGRVGGAVRLDFGRRDDHGDDGGWIVAHRHVPHNRGARRHGCSAAADRGDGTGGVTADGPSNRTRSSRTRRAVSPPGTGGARLPGR